MSIKRKFVLGLTSLVIAGAGVVVTAGSAEAATGCTATITKFGHTSVIYANSTAKCTGVTGTGYVTKAYMYYVDKYVDGNYLGNPGMTDTTPSSVGSGKSGSQSVTAQDDHCEYLFTTTIYWTSGGTRHSAGDSAKYNVCR